MKIIVTDEVTDEGLALLQADPRISLDVRLGLSREELHACVGAYDAIITRSGTTVNVIGNGLASVVIAKWEGVFGTDPEPLPDQET